eukprot:scaffold8641_cov85-Cylindrotheca_fusiformis.AAC.1
MEKRIAYVETVVQRKQSKTVDTSTKATQQQQLMTPDSSSTMAKTTKATTSMAPTDRSNNASLWKGLVRVEGRFANKVKNRIETSKFIQEMYESIKSNADPDFRMGDKDGNMFSMDGIPETYAEFTQRFNLQVIDKGSHQHLMLVATFESTKIFGTLKSGCFKVLKRHNLYLHPHPFPAEKIDVGAAGFILGANARYHSPQEQKARLRNVVFQWWMEQPVEVIAQWKERFQSDKEGTDVIPDFFVNAKVAKGRDVFGRDAAAASAFLVMSPAKTIKAFSSLLETVFKPGENTTQVEHNVRFVPSRLQYTSSEVYTKLIKQQQMYLHNYGAISVAGLCRERMYRSVTTKDPISGREQTLPVHTILMSHPHVHRIDPAGSLATLGKWNIETTKAHLEEVKEHVDKVIEQLPVDVREGTGFKYFPNVTRMKAARQPTEDDDKYSQWIKPPTTAEEASVLTPGTGVSSHREYSDNPQQADIPNLLHFPSVQESQERTSTYAQKASYGYTQGSEARNSQMAKSMANSQEDPPEKTTEYIQRLLQSGFDEVSGYLTHKINTELAEIKESIQATPTKVTPATTVAPSPQDGADANMGVTSDTDNEVDPSLKMLLIKFMADSKQTTAGLQEGLNSMNRKQGRLHRGVEAVVERMNGVSDDMDQLAQSHSMMAESYQILNDRLLTLEAAFDERHGTNTKLENRKKRNYPDDSVDTTTLPGDDMGYETANESSHEEQETEQASQGDIMSTGQNGDIPMDDMSEDGTDMATHPAEGGTSAWHP